MFEVISPYLTCPEVVKTRDATVIKGANCITLNYWFIILFRDGIPSLSSSYKIPGLVPACWLLFQCC